MSSFFFENVEFGCFLFFGVNNCLFVLLIIIMKDVVKDIKI